MPEPLEPFRWREPTSTLRLRWGGYHTRMLGGLLLIVGGGLAVAGGAASSPFANFLLYAGSIAHITGWSVLPSAGWRRVWALVPSTAVMWALLAGPGWLWILVFPYLGWLLVRHRPIAAYPTLLFVIVGAVLVAPLFPSYDLMLPALGTMGAIMLLSALAARAVHVAQARSRDVRRRRKLRNSSTSSP
ncbi:MAG: hypothetical protein WBL06_01875 [Pseudolysinimonas sp.]|uniref:hypothetical protein n=1 Tax=Pseudolysinimonas sp. TaxID=2680009 RepID=UPI003C714105